MADGSASKGIGDEDENHLTISDKSINVTSEVYGDVAGKNSSVSEVSVAGKNSSVSEDDSGKTIEELRKEIQNMAAMLREVHNVVTKPPPNPLLPPPVVLQVNATLEQPFRWQDLLLPMLIIGSVFLAFFYVGKKIDQVRLEVVNIFVAVRDAIRSWEAAGRPALIINRFALWNNRQTSSRASS